LTIESQIGLGMRADSADEVQTFRREMGTISRQSGVFFLGAIFTAALGYVFRVYLARVLGAEALGIYALGMTVVGLVGIFGGLGLTSAASRFPLVYGGSGRFEDLRSFLVWSILSLAGVNGLFLLGVVFARHWIATTFYHTPSLVNYLLLFGLIMFVGTLTNFFGQLLQGYKQVAKRTLITNFVGAVLSMAFTVVLVELGTGLWGYIFAQLASAVVVLILLALASYRLTPGAARVSFRPVHFPPREVLSFAAAAFAMDVLGFLYTQTDKVILGVYLDARSVGIYVVAATIIQFLPIALQSVNQIFSPMIADLHARGETAMLNRLFQTLTKWVAGLTLPLVAVVAIFSRVLMRIFGQDFEVGWAILVIGSLGQLVNCAVGSVGYLLLMSGNQRRLVRIQVVTAVVTVGCCLLMVPRWGLAGAAIAMAVGNAGSNAWCLWEVKRVLGLFPYTRGYWRLTPPALASVAAAVGLRIALRSVSPDILMVVLAAAAVYAVFVGAVLMAGLEADDRLIANAIWSRVRNFLPKTQTGIA